ncbi:chorion peroxidase, partial [Brachionus plicatilis]
QFSDVKVADRFWYENGDDKNVRLTVDQLNEIRHANAARLICDNTNLKDVQKFPFLMPNYRFNSYVSCKELPEVSLRPWTDYGSGPSESYDGDHENYE